MRYTTLLLDADNTLFDFDRAEHTAILNTLSAFGYPHEEAIAVRYHDINLSLWKQLERGEVAKSQLIYLRFARLFEALGIEGDPIAFNEQYVVRLGKGHDLLPHALSVCQALADTHTLYIITNGTLAVQTARFAASPITPLFRDIFISEQVGAPKPSPAFFAYVTDHIDNFDAARTLVVGDSLSSDIRGGVEAGLDTCWFNSKHAANHSGLTPTYEIDDLRLLPELVG